MLSQSSTQSDSGLRVRGFCGVLNNWTPVERQRLMNMFSDNKGKFKYIIFAPEIAPTTGTPHLQAYFSLSNNMTLRAFQKFLTNYQGFDSRWALQCAKGDALSNRVYCMKSDTDKPNEDVFEFGAVPLGQGNRSDLEGVQEMVLAGASMREIAMTNFAAVVKYSRGIQYAVSLLASQARTDRTIGMWFHGNTGTGKSRFAHRFAKAFPKGGYVKNGGNKWFCGYEQGQVIIIDDYRPNKELSFSMLLQLADYNDMILESKGGSFGIGPCPYIIITSPVDIKTAFAHLDFVSEGNIAQALRRFKEYDFNNPGILEYLEPILKEQEVTPVVLPELVDPPVMIRQTNHVLGLIQEEEAAQFENWTDDDFIQGCLGFLDDRYCEHCGTLVALTDICVCQQKLGSSSDVF